MKTNINGLLQGRITRWGLVAAVVTVMATSALAQTSGQTRPFKAAGVSALTVDPNDPLGASGTFEIVGNATHLGKFVFPGTWRIVGVNENGGFVYHIQGAYTAANGDTIQIDCPDWGVDDGVNSAVSTGIVNIIGGTGRFANASGSYVGALSPAPSPTVFTAQGTISY